MLQSIKFPFEMLYLRYVFVWPSLCGLVLIKSSQRAFPGQTINGIKIDSLDKNGNLSQKVFRHHARLHLPSLQPLLHERVEEAFATEIESQKMEYGECLPRQGALICVCIKFLYCFSRLDIRLCERMP